MLTFLVRLYALLVRTYPRLFRVEFEGEMQDVFEEASADAARRGKASLLTLCVRELWDWPKALLTQHWSGLVSLYPGQRPKEGSMLEATHVRQAGGAASPMLAVEDDPGSWGEALLAALPHLFVALVWGVQGTLYAYGLPSSRAEGSPLYGLLLGLAFLGALLGGLAYAWRRGWPRWSASWIPYGCALVAAPVGLLLQEWDPLAGGPWSEGFWYVVLPLALAGLLLRVSQRDPIVGLLAALPAVTLLWTIALEFVPLQIREPLTLGAWLLIALVAAAIVRSGRLGRGTWLALGASLLIGFSYCYVRTYWNNVPPQVASGFSTEQPTVGALLHRTIPPYLALSTLILGPLLAQALRKIGERGGRTGLWGYRLAVAGLLLCLASNLGTFWWIAAVYRSLYRYSGVLGLSAIAVLGVMGYSCGAFLLGLAAVWDRPLSEAAPSALIVIASLALPLVATLPMVYGFRYIPHGWPLGLYYVQYVPKAVVYAVGAAWLLLGAWLVTRRNATTRSSAV